MHEWTTERLRLEPIRREHAADLWKLHQDDGVAVWWDGKWTHELADEWATTFERRWAADGVSKWIAYDRIDGSLVGRGGLSRVPVDGETCIEIGWTVHSRLWGQGYGPRSAGPGSTSHSASSAPRRSWRSPSPTTFARVRSWSGSGCTDVREFTQDGGPFVLYAIHAPKD